MYLGTISYSIYLVHGLALYGIGMIGHQKVLSLAVWVGLTLALSSLTYRWIEKPAIDLGRKVSARTPKERRQPPAPRPSVTPG